MRSRFARWLPTAYLYALDVLGAVVVTAVYMGFAENSGVPLWFGYLVAVLVGAPLAVRRKWPMAALIVVVTAQDVASALHITLEPYIPSAAAMYMMAATEHRKRSVGALVFALVTSAVAIPLGERWPDSLGLAAVVALLLGGAWALGRSTLVRRGYAERALAEQASRAVADERLRIARELHDVVAHSLSLITVKAGIANHVADSRPEQAREALQVIEAASRSTLVEMRRLLGVLRAEDASAELAPVPGLADLPGLVERAALAGVPVDLSVTGGPLPDGVGLTVFRVVQESVTNVVKHAAPARCSVVVAVQESSVRISVTDDGRGERVLTGGGGHGLIGMRERVAVYGGTFSAGPMGGGGFRVAAEVPLA
ncbi:sensor histidine kinase [Saccharothrix algeriensis]|uniref:histidine kinase n=1 Tax=Saccharothrix algeriensis TaxID=173560 RepID=A0A8T8HZK0_9PSEU|nr:histidine kinase [Saccharothrix algeriensis]MBM7809487.1 signal transduction histidine kinase [Saccharothrix algeriensis]QTR03819.1 sensor histidine kinase [Saccharothrix algeriensis]